MWRCLNSNNEVPRNEPPKYSKTYRWERTLKSGLIGTGRHILPYQCTFSPGLYLAAIPHVSAKCDISVSKKLDRKVRGLQIKCLLSLWVAQLLETFSFIFFPPDPWYDRKRRNSLFASIVWGLKKTTSNNSRLISLHSSVFGGADGPSITSLCHTSHFISAAASAHSRRWAPCHAFSFTSWPPSLATSRINRYIHISLPNHIYVVCMKKNHLINICSLRYSLWFPLSVEWTHKGDSLCVQVFFFQICPHGLFCHKNLAHFLFWQGHSFMAIIRQLQ